LEVKVEVWFTRVSGVAAAADRLPPLDLVTRFDTDTSLFQMRKEAVFVFSVLDDDVISGEAILERINPAGSPMMIPVTIFHPHHSPTSWGQDRFVETIERLHPITGILRTAGIVGDDKVVCVSLPRREPRVRILSIRAPVQYSPLAIKRGAVLNRGLERLWARKPSAVSEIGDDSAGYLEQRTDRDSRMNEQRQHLERLERTWLVSNFDPRTRIIFVSH
jgi:hypothetical protein